MSQRCPDCGRFMGDGHNCPNNAPIPHHDDQRDRTIEFERRPDGSYVANGEKHPDVSSLEDLLRHVGADPDRFAVERWLANRWPTSAMQDGELTQIENLQVKAWLTPKTGEDNPIPAPVQLKVPERTFSPEKRTSGPYMSLHLCDEQIPYHDPRAINIVYQILERHDVDLIVHHGDAADCSEISEYEKDPNDRIGLDREIQMTAEHFGTLTQLAPDAERKYFLGNHEDRKRRQVWKLADDRVAGEILTLPDVQKALQWKNLLGIDDYGWEITPYPDHEVLFDRLVLKHGETSRKHASYTARQEYEKYGKSGMSGHTHRRGVYERRDYNGSHAWWEIGCLCDLNPSYTEFPNWQQGAIMVTWSEDRTEFDVERIRIHDGVAYFRGERYEGDSTLFNELAEAA